MICLIVIKGQEGDVLPRGGMLMFSLMYTLLLATIMSVSAAALRGGQLSNVRRMGRPPCRAALPRASAGDEVDDPIYRDELWVRGEEVRYGDGGSSSGVGYCTSYLPFTVARNHTRAILCLETEPSLSGSAALRSFADRVALSCECVALLPKLEGGLARWPHERLANEILTACRYLNRAYGTEVTFAAG
jgi:hypothetical protein